MILDGTAHQRLAQLGGGLKVHHFSLVLRPKGASNGQEIHRLQQASLALGVGPKEHDNAGGKLQFQLDQIAKIGEGEARKLGQPLRDLQ